MDNRYSFTALTFNIFIGSPLPLPAPGRVFTPRLRPGAPRLQAQIAQVVASGADVVALQEVLCDDVAAAYAAALGAVGYDVYVARRRSARGVLAAHALYALCALAAWGAAAAAAAAVVALAAPSQAQPAVPPLAALASDLAALAPLLLGYFAAWRALRRTTAVAFLTNSVHGGLALAYKRDVFSRRASWTVSFSEQAGDFLNVWRPRAFQVAVLEPRRRAHGRGEHALVVVNVHMNLGSDGPRAAQLEHALAFAGGPAVAAAAGGLPASTLLLGDTNALDGSPSMRRLTAPAAAGGLGFTDVGAGAGAGPGGHTWSAANPLTRGFQLEPDGRLDWVLLRAGEARAVVGDDAPPGAAGAAAVRRRSPAVAPVAARLVFTGAPHVSDHYGVLATFVACTPGALRERRLGAPLPAAVAVATPGRRGIVARAAAHGADGGAAAAAVAAAATTAPPPAALSLDVDALLRLLGPGCGGDDGGATVGTPATAATSSSASVASDGGDGCGDAAGRGACRPRDRLPAARVARRPRAVLDDMGYLATPTRGAAESARGRSGAGGGMSRSRPPPRGRVGSCASLASSASASTDASEARVLRTPLWGSGASDD